VFTGMFGSLIGLAKYLLIFLIIEEKIVWDLLKRNCRMKLFFYSPCSLSLDTLVWVKTDQMCFIVSTSGLRVRFCDLPDLGEECFAVLYSRV